MLGVNCKRLGGTWPSAAAAAEAAAAAAAVGPNCLMGVLTGGLFAEVCFCACRSEKLLELCDWGYDKVLAVGDVGPVEGSYDTELGAGDATLGGGGGGGEGG